MTIVSANEFALVSVRLRVPYRGAWWAELEFVDAPTIESSIEILIDDLRLTGAIVPGRDGSHVAHKKCLVFGGAASWGSEVPALHYRSDTGVQARLVADDIVRAIGETIGTFEPTEDRIGIHYVRQSGIARRILEDIIGDVIWWVDYDGITHVSSERPEIEADPEDYRVLDYDPLNRLATLEIQTPGGVVVGSLLDEGLDEDQPVRELVLTASAQGLRMQVWTGAGKYGLADSQAYTAYHRYADSKLFGSWRYRVNQMNGERVDARPVLSSSGLPDLVGVEISPGIAGYGVDLPSGLEILVEFIEGNRTLPRVVAFSGRDQANWTPTESVIDADGIKLGKDAANEVALHNLVEDELTALKSAISGASVAANDGGAKFKSDILAALASWPGSTAADKVKAE